MDRASPSIIEVRISYFMVDDGVFNVHSYGTKLNE